MGRLGVGRAGGMSDVPRLRLGRPGGMVEAAYLGVRRPEGMENVACLEVIEGGGRMDEGRFGWAEGRGMGGVAGGGKR